MHPMRAMEWRSRAGPVDGSQTAGGMRINADGELRAGSAILAAGSIRHEIKVADALRP
jgi:hypothetical protein